MIVDYRLIAADVSRVLSLFQGDPERCCKETMGQSQDSSTSQADSSPLSNYGLRSGEVEVFPEGQKVVDSQGNTLAARDSLALQESSYAVWVRQEHDADEDYLDDSRDPTEEHARSMDSNDDGTRLRRVITMVCLLSMVVLAIILGAVLTHNNRGDNQYPEPNVASGAQMSDNVAVTTTPSLAPTAAIEATMEYQLLEPYVNPPSLLLDPESPQGEAFRQILSEQISEDPEFRIKQRFAMMATYFAMGGTNWTWQTGWNDFSENECDWHGVAICRYNDGRKIAAGLRIASNNAVGTLPQEICMLESLETLVVESNQLSGNLPECLTGLASVFEFNFRKNSFSGTPPSGFLSMPRLETLDLSSNEFTGDLEFLAESGTMNATGSRLKTLRLSNNGFDGELPSEIYSLDSLQELTLHGTSVTGNVSDICDNGGVWIVTTNCTLMPCNSDCCECL